MKFFESKRNQRMTNVMFAVMLVVSTLTASVPFLFSQKAHAAGYNISVTPYCVDGHVSFDIKGDNTSDKTVYVKSSADFLMSQAVTAGAQTNGISIPLNTAKASVPASTVTIYYSDTADGTFNLLEGATADYAAFNCYSPVYVATAENGGSDTNQGTTAESPFLTIQKALDTVNENGTVNVANGMYDGTAVFKKNGTKLIGQTKAGVTLYAQSSSGQAGVFADGVNDITLKKFTVRPGTSLTSGAIVKFTNGQNGKIENVDVKATTEQNLTGIDINSFAHATLYNIYINGVGKDGVSVTSKYSPTSIYTSNDISMSYVSVSHSLWAGFAFYTITKKIPSGTSMTGLQLNNIRAQYNRDGIYFEGLNGKTISGVEGNVNLRNAVLKDSSKIYVINAQTKDVDAYNVTFDEKKASQMTSAEFADLQTKIIDHHIYSYFGIVNLRTPLGTPVVQTQGWVNAATSVNWTAATDRTATDLKYTFSYSTDRYTGYTDIDNGNSTSRDVSQLFTTPGSYFVRVSATEEGVTTPSSPVVEIQVIGKLAITSIDGSKQTGSTATVNWSPVYGREQFSNYEVYVNDEKVVTITDKNSTSASIVLPAKAGAAAVYVKANFNASIAGSDFRQSDTQSVNVVPVPSSTDLSTPTSTPLVVVLARPSITTVTPTITGPVQSTPAVLGATTTNTDNTPGDTGVKGTTSDKTLAAAVNSDANKGTIFGLAWFWWILILAALAAIAWFITAAIRRRNENQA